MKKALVIPLSDEELMELYRIIIDRDKEAALNFLDRFVRKRVLQALEGG
ncbi:MAG: hypothetical protein J7M05_09540 [Anaerolineae bacterium]|nr:hypothetical protein [Anaerolineae bacterium]